MGSYGILQPAAVLKRRPRVLARRLPAIPVVHVSHRNRRNLWKMWEPGFPRKQLSDAEEVGPITCHLVIVQYL